jgi:hypothetical protein
MPAQPSAASGNLGVLVRPLRPYLTASICINKHAKVSFRGTSSVHAHTCELIEAEGRWSLQLRSDLTGEKNCLCFGSVVQLYSGEVLAPVGGEAVSA